MGFESSDVVRFGLGPLPQGQMMVYWLWQVVLSVDTNLHWFSDVLGQVNFVLIFK